MKKEAPPKPEHISPLLMALILVIVVIPSAVCWYFFFGLFAALAFAVFFGGLFALFRFITRKYRLGEVESRLDNAINKSNDDPRTMARWIP
jgi:hypothetical protein